VFEVWCFESAVADARPGDRRVRLSRRTVCRFALSIPYAKSDLTPWRALSVRAACARRSRLPVFHPTRYESAQVLPRPGSPAQTTEPADGAGRVRAVSPRRRYVPWRRFALAAGGDSAAASWQQRWQLRPAHPIQQLFAAFRPILDRPAPNSFDDIAAGVLRRPCQPAWVLKADLIRRKLRRQPFGP